MSSQVDLSRTEQMRDEERRRLENAKRFLTQLTTKRTEGMDMVRDAVLSGGTTPEHACARLRCSPAELVPFVEDWIKSQTSRLEAAEKRLAESAALWRAEREVRAEDDRALIAAFADSENPAKEQREREAKRLQRIAAKVEAAR